LESAIGSRLLSISAQRTSWSARNITMMCTFKATRFPSPICKTSLKAKDLELDRPDTVPPVDTVVKKLQKFPRAPASAPVNHDIAGFMPGRKEFEHEYENEAEIVIKDMEFTDQDTPQEIGTYL
jgi:hypothetical protein